MLAQLVGKLEDFIMSNYNTVKEKMIVGFIAPEFLPNWGGVGTYSIELVKHLSRYLDVHVITLERIIEDSDIVYTEEDILDYFDGRIHLHILGKATNTFLYNAKFQYSIWKSLPLLIKKHNFDILHSNFPHMPDILYKMKRQHIPTVTTVHTTIEGQKQGIQSSGLGPQDMSDSEKYTLVLYRFLREAEKFYLKKTPYAITVSYWMKNLLKEKYPFISDISVIHNGVDSNNFSPEKEKNSTLLENVTKPIVLFSSRLTAAKGAQFLIKAIPEILKENKEVHFVFAGGGSKEPWLKMLKNYGVSEDYYTFLGYVDYRDLPSLYAKATIYIAPTLYENLPIRILEAMSSGTPVIASDICAIPEIIKNGKNGLLIQPGNFAQITKTILMLLSDAKYARKLSLSGRKTIQDRFEWDKIALMTKDVYEKILEGRK